MNKAFAEVTGGKVNRGGYGLEVPCVYRLYGPKVYEGVGELPENSWTSLASSVIINRGLWLVSRSQTRSESLAIRETRLWPSVRYLEVILY